jgi:hypothetical protein
MPKIGDVVFVTEVDNLTEETTVSPAIVTHVLGEEDGPGDWWKIAQNRGIVQAQVFRRDGTGASVTVGKIDEDNPTGYLTSPDGSAAVAEPSPDAGTTEADATPAPVPDTVNDGSGSGDGGTTDGGGNPTP